MVFQVQLQEIAGAAELFGIYYRKPQVQHKNGWSK